MSDLPRLLLCCFDVVPAPTAISRRMTEYLKGLSDRFQVVVLTVKTPDHTHIERYHGARLLRVPVGAGDLASRVQSFDRAVRRQLDSEEYVMVHSFDPFGGYALCERRSEFGYKIVYDSSALPSVDLPFLHDEAEANRRFIARVRRQELFCLMNADAVIVANDLTREFVTGLGVAREHVSVLPCPVDLGPYKPEVMGVPDATPMKLVHVGNLSNANDFPTVLEAMQLALQSGVDLGLTVVGPRHPAHQARLEERIAALKLAGKVEFQDPVAHDDVHKVLATADVGLVSLSDVERNEKVGSPLSRAAEYLAAGRPIVAADVASARATLQEEGVVFYKPGDKNSLADAIVSLASAPAQRVKLGQAARGQAVEHDGAKIRADLFALYVALTGTGNRAVGDAEDVNPDEVTQLGQSLGAEDTKERKRRADAAEKKTTGEQKVTTDPAVAVADTSPEAAMSDRPAVMGVPLREEEPPIVKGFVQTSDSMGQEAREIANELVQQVTTEPNALRPTEPPVVMGMPLPSQNQPIPATTVPAMMTPGDLAAELGQVDEPRIPHSSPTVIEQPVGDEPMAPLEQLPDTGAHLSLVPKEPEPPAPRSRGAAPGSGPVPAVSGKKRGTRGSKGFVQTSGEKGFVQTSEPAPEKAPAEPRELDPVAAELAAAEKLEQAAEKLAAANRSSPEQRAATENAVADKLTIAAEKLVAEKSAFEKSIFAPEKPKAEGDAKSLEKPKTETTDKSAFEKSIFAPEKPKTEAAKAASTTADDESTPSKSADAFRTAEHTPTPTNPAAPPAPASPLEASTIPAPRPSIPPLPEPSAPRFIPPLEMPGPTPAVKSTASGLTPVLAPKPSISTVAAALTPKSSTSGIAPALVPPSSSSGLTPVLRTTSGVMPIAPAVAKPPEFVPLLTPPQSGPSTSPSGVTKPPALPVRSASGTFAVIPPPLPGAGAGQTPPALTRPSGLFPEAPLIPRNPPTPKPPEIISDSEIEEVSDADVSKVPEVTDTAEDGPEEIGDDELMEVPPTGAHRAVTAAPAPAPSQTSDDAPEMAPEDVGVQTVDTDASPPPSAIDPWLAMLVHGYCPPASGLFNRHTPPTTMPGRDT